MGISIDLYIFEYAKLMKKLIKLGAEEILLYKILTECGTISGGKYILLNNEKHDDGNPFNIVCDLIDSAFNVRDSIDVFLDDFKMGKNYVDRNEAAEKLGITLRDEI